MTKSPWMNLLEPTVIETIRDDGYFHGGTPPADASIAISLKRIADALEVRNNANATGTAEQMKAETEAFEKAMRDPETANKGVK